MYFGRLLAVFIGFIAFIVILVLLIGGGGKKEEPVNPLKPLPEYASTDATVTFLTDGIVNGDELHRQIRITIGSDSRTLDILQGYNGQVISSKSFSNNQDAYGVFLRAINNFGFVAKNKTKSPDDERGICPLGFRYILSLNQDGVDLSRTWGSTCGAKVGTSGGSTTTLQTLFQDQIPDYTSRVGNVNLSATGTNSF